MGLCSILGPIGFVMYMGLVGQWAVVLVKNAVVGSFLVIGLQAQAMIALFSEQVLRLVGQVAV